MAKMRLFNERNDHIDNGEIVGLNSPRKCVRQRALRREAHRLTSPRAPRAEGGGWGEGTLGQHMTPHPSADAWRRAA
eukprot:69579-Prymnesium_polylepis.1